MDRLRTCVSGIRNWQEHWAEQCVGKNVFLMFDSDGLNEQSIDAMAAIELSIEPRCLTYKSVIPRFKNDINELMNSS